MAGAGQLRELVRIERRAAATPDGFGNTEGDWETIAQTAAQIKPIRGNEAVTAAKLEGQQIVEIIVRWQPALADLSTDARVINIRVPDAIFNILAVENKDMRRKYLAITAETGVAT